ncbi:MAG TPA: metal ABC transporter ATP-binding protein [Bacteroidales bacterium]|nr:metal ABC transporter ATP-binding protein [Bacteroidales bacterium]
MAFLLEIKSLSASYDRNIVLRDIDFRVNENDFIGVIGPNGGGKTTLLKLILGLLKPTKGSITFNSELLSANTIGYLPQISTGDINYPVTVTDVVLSGMMIKKKILSRMSSDDKKRAGMVIGELGLKGLEKSPMNELSGGQLQRVFLGRAIIGDPRLLLLDEPGNFVDSTFENDFYEKLKELNSRMAILMVSHDIGMISSHVKSYACVNRSLHYHPSSEISNEQLLAYGCPIQLITHGDVPHTVLKQHNHS